jgi:hypothetical protein
MYGVPQLAVERWAHGAAMRRLATAFLAAAAIAMPVTAAADSNSGLPGSSGLSLSSSAPTAAGSACSVDLPSAESFARLIAAARATAGGPSLEAPPAGTLAVTCALPYDNGKPGSDCTGKHKIVFKTTGATTGAKVTAELLGLDANGNILQALSVKNGDVAHLASRVSASDFKMVSKKGTHEVFAPVPLLRVTVEDQGQKVQAFCSNIPYVEVVEPKDEVVAESDGNVTNVLAAIPLVHGPALDLKVDGVHIFDAAHLNLPDPTVCTLSSPCGGTIDINGTMVTVENLAIDLASAVHLPSSNTLRATFKDLSCGGHVFVLNGERIASLPPDPTNQCLVDDTTDKGSSSVFAIDITSPTPGEVTNAVPTPVIGEVCSGRPITSLKLNGLAVNVGGLTCTPGDGENTGTTCVVPINTALGQTDLQKDITTGDAPLGTFDAGSNRLVAAAIDDLGNRTYARVVFATGAVAAPGVDLNAAFAQTALRGSLDNELKSMLTAKVQQAMTATSTEIDNAFVVGISPAGTQTLFDKLCTSPNPDAADPNFGRTPVELFTENIREALLARDASNPLKTGNLAVDCSCNPDYKIYVQSVSVGSDIACPVTFQDGKFHVDIDLPDVTVTVKAEGRCQDDVLDVCVARTVVDMTSTGTIKNIRLGFDVTEGNLLNSTTSAPDFTFSGTSDVVTSGGVDLQCIGADICEVALTVLTLGLIDFSPQIDISKTTDFSSQIGASEPDPVKLKEIKVDEEVVANFDQKLSGEVSSVKITPNGIVAGLKGSFATTVVDPETEATPGAVLTPAPLPTLPVPNAQDVFIGLSDDSMNMMFASMTTAGKLKSTCNTTGKTLADLLPASCDTITLDTPIATALARGACYGVRIDTSCEAIVMPDDPNGVNTASAQGVCHAYRGDNCNTLPLQGGLLAAAAEKAVCANTPNPNLRSDQALLFCANADVPPRMLLEDNTSTTAVEAALRVNDLSVAMIVDRDTTGNVDGPIANVASCFGKDAPTNIDCNLFASCVDLNFNFNMQFQTCNDGKPGFLNQFTSIQILNREAGVVCGGTSNMSTDSTVVNASSSDEAVTIDLTGRAQQFAPPVCGAGLSMGGFVTCDLPTLLAIESDGNPALKDYIAITCKINK